MPQVSRKVPHPTIRGEWIECLVDNGWMAFRVDDISAVRFCKGKTEDGSPFASVNIITMTGHKMAVRHSYSQMMDVIDAYYDGDDVAGLDDHESRVRDFSEPIRSH